MNNAKRLGWSEYYGDTVINVEITNNGTAIYDAIPQDNANCYIYLCKFIECIERGAIYITRAETSSLVEDCSFTGCKSFREGGSVYFNAYFGEIIQSRNCYEKSVSTHSYMAYYQQGKAYDPMRNWAFDISVSNCGVSESEGIGTYCHLHSEIRLKNNNITNNKCNKWSSLHTSIEDAEGYCSFSTFRNNKQKESLSLDFGSYTVDPTKNYSINYCNVIRNKCGTDNNQVLLQCRFDSTIVNCVFLRNTAVIMFKVDESDCTMTIIDSCIQSNSSTGSVSFIFENISHEILLNCVTGSKVLTAKVSCFWPCAEFSISLLIKSN